MKKLLSRKAVFGLLMVLLLLLPVMGMAEVITRYQIVNYVANDDLYFWFDPATFEADAEAYDYLTTHFVRDWDGDGVVDSYDMNEKVAVEWTGVPDEGDCEEEFGFYETCISAYVEKATKVYDGKQVTLTLTNMDNGNQFVTEFTASFCGLVSEPFAIETEGFVGEEPWGPYVELKIGQTATFTVNHSYIGDKNYTIEYEWFAYDEYEEIVPLDETGKTYVYTMEAEYGGLGCYVYLKDANGEVVAMSTPASAYFYLPFPEVTLDVVCSHRVVNNVLRVTEGDVVSIDLNPTCEDPEAELEYTWFLVIYDEDGYGTDWRFLDHDNESITFTVTADMDGWILYGEAYGTGLKSNPIEYTMVVLPEGTPVPDEELKVEIEEGLTADSLSDELKAIPTLNTPEKVEADITIKLLAEASAEGLDVVQNQTAVYDVTLMVSLDGGNTFVEATKENWPESGKLTVVLPYPEGTGKDTHTFVVAHMFTHTTAAHQAGDVEYPTVVNTDEGIQFEVTGLSPIALGWETNTVSEPPATGDNAMPWLWMLGMLLAGAGCVMLCGKRRQNG